MLLLLLWASRDEVEVFGIDTQYIGNWKQLFRTIKSKQDLLKEHC